MRLLFPIIIFSFSKICMCDNNILNFFEQINKNVVKLNAISAEMEWTSSINPLNPDIKIKSEIYINERILWQRNICKKLSVLQNHYMLNNTQQRQAYLLCRGPAYKLEEVRSLYNLNEKMKNIYNNVEICIPRTILFRADAVSNLTYIENTIMKYLSMSKDQTKLNNSHQRYITIDNKMCFKHKDMEELVTYSRNEQVLKWIWLTWREKTGPHLKQYYRSMVNIENKAARRNGYTDLGETWREELEIPNLRSLCRRLYKSIRPLYMLLHGVVRYFLRVQYGDVVPEFGPIPAHLLGNLWMQNWETLADIIIPNTIDLDNRMRHMNWDVKHMVKRAEDFYLSLSLPSMTDKFWRKSVFSEEGNKNVRCHGTAADMFKKDDYRMLYCSGVSLQDFNVIHHEMGHIQYYMAYEKQPGLFRQANSALHESIGEAIIIGALTPQHLNRLGLINDSLLYSVDEETITTVTDKEESNDKNKSTQDSIKDHMEKSVENVTTDEILLLKRALNKLPQIPFSLLVEEYRWKYFEGRIDMKALNENFWDMTLQLQGISPPEYRGEELFDAGAIYHVADNTPLVRYFLSNFLQHQLFEYFCKVSVFGNLKAQEHLPKTMILNRCDIYGAKATGKVLMNLMSYGHSQTWQEILKRTIDQDDISPEPLLRYYEPLHQLLTKIVATHNIPIGW